MDQTLKLDSKEDLAPPESRPCRLPRPVDTDPQHVDGQMIPQQDLPEPEPPLGANPLLVLGIMALIFLALLAPIMMLASTANNLIAP